MKHFLLSDNDTGEIIAVVQSEGLDNGRFLKKAKTAVKEHFVLESIESANFVDSKKKTAVYAEGTLNNEPVGYVVGVIEVVCY